MRGGLILGKVFGHLPDLQVVSGHWGEMVPFFLNRLDDVLSPGDTGLSRTITETYRSHVWGTPPAAWNTAPSPTSSVRRSGST
ncbi:putative TIM-barrel fold metal-dependent hydrolase [Streptomyces tendae]